MYEDIALSVLTDSTYQLLFSTSVSTESAHSAMCMFLNQFTSPSCIDDLHLLPTTS